jgi:ABC-2 type transport system permease protein
MILQSGDEAQLLYPPADLSEGEIRTAIESALKRTSSGFLKVVGLWTPPDQAAQNPQFGGVSNTFSAYTLIREQLRQEYTVRDIDLTTGQVPSDVDVLLVVAAQNLTDFERFAIDQYLMRGGAVALALSPFQVGADNFSGNLFLQPNVTGLEEWLENYGIQLPGSLVLDPQNQPFPVAVMRQVGGIQVQEIQAVDYPFFVDVRPDGMDTNSPIAANVAAVTMNWAAPVELDPEKSATFETSTLLRSSDQSWLRDDTSVQPDFGLYPELGFAVGDEQQSYPLAVSLQGSFDSYFQDKPTPFETVATEETGEEALPGAPTPSAPAGIITSSSESSRLVIIGSAAFAEDFVLNLSSRLIQDRYLNNLLFLQNVVDWSVEDLDLLAIRARGSASRVLFPMEENSQTGWEVANYAVALIALVGIYYAWRVRSHSEQPMELVPAMPGHGEVEGMEVTD